MKSPHMLKYSEYAHTITFEHCERYGHAEFVTITIHKKDEEQSLDKFDIPIKHLKELISEIETYNLD